MNMVVCIKQVPDTAAQVRVKPDGSGIVTEGLNWVLNPYDEYAVEEALRIKERLGEGKVTVITVGPDQTSAALRSCVAMGADEAVQIWDAGLERADTSVTARLLATGLKRLEWDLVLCGKVAVDDNASSVGPAVAELLGAPHVSAIVSLAVDKGAQTIRAERETEDGAEVVECRLPAVVTAEKGLNEPRYASLPNIMKAKRKEITKWTLNDLGLQADDPSLQPRTQVLQTLPPPERPAGRVVQGELGDLVEAITGFLRDEAKAI